MHAYTLRGAFEASDQSVRELTLFGAIVKGLDDDGFLTRETALGQDHHLIHTIPNALSDATSR